MVLWEWIALAYFTYLAVVAFIGRRFVRARKPALVAMSCCALLGGAAAYWPQPVARALVPIPILLAGYWVSGFFFVRPMHRAERWLLHVDEWLMSRAGALSARPRFVNEYLELTYALVYAVIPAGALTLLLGGGAAAVSRFWAVVLLAEFISYGMLPWLQTRPPRVLEAAVGPGGGRSVVRRLNLIVLKGSIQVNTIPSGHAAGAVAVGLAVGDSMPIAGAAFLILAASIVTATVVGRYHYFVDSVLGALVACGAWYLLR